MGFVRFMASGTGRMIRVIAGVGLIGVGLLVVGGVWGMVIAVVALVPLLAGAFDVCVFAPLFRAPFSGREARNAVRRA